MHCVSFDEDNGRLKLLVEDGRDVISVGCYIHICDPTGRYLWTKLLWEDHCSPHGHKHAVAYSAFPCYARRDTALERMQTVFDGLQGLDILFAAIRGPVPVVVTTAYTDDKGCAHVIVPLAVNSSSDYWTFHAVKTMLQLNRWIGVGDCSQLFAYDRGVMELKFSRG